MAWAIETHALTRRYGALAAVDRVDLRVAEGEVYGYLGVNGAGKSTTIKMLATLLPPSGGRATVAGHDIQRDALRVRSLIGLVGDEGGPDARPDWTAREYLGYFARLHRLRAPRREVELVLDLMGVDGAARRRRLATYSTGMKRRVEVARAFLGRPRVLFLDEPTRGLDLPGKRELWAFFRHLAQRERVTLFLSSHEVNEIRALCRRLAVIARGRLVFRGEAAQLGPDAAAFEEALARLLGAHATPTAGRAPGGFPWSS